jgi:hypothetical protein
MPGTGVDGMAALGTSGAKQKLIVEKCPAAVDSKEKS